MSKQNEEATYNIARAFHQIGILELAVSYYHKLLSFSVSENLKREAAYNLSLIYRESSSPELANKILIDYITV